MRNRYTRKRRNARNRVEVYDSRLNMWQLVDNINGYDLEIMSLEFDTDSGVNTSSGSSSASDSYSSSSSYDNYSSDTSSSYSSSSSSSYSSSDSSSSSFD